MRGPLDVLKESWEGGRKSSESVVSYIVQIREMMDKMRHLVQDNLERSRNYQKQWYDWPACTRARIQGGRQGISTNSLSD